MAEHKISEVLAKPDAALEMTLRPSLFSEFTGQLKVKERLEITVAAAKQRGEAIDHILFSGPPGLGKTTLAHIMAKSMGASLKSTSGPTIEKAGDLAGLLTNLEEGDVLFIDEIHRLQKTIEEYLYPAMEDFKLDIIIDQGPNARSVRLNLPRFTLIGATTRSGLLTAPLLTRFPIRERLDYYQAEQLQQIVVRSARLLNVETEEQGAREIARRSRGTPRIANNLLRRVRDYAQVRHEGRITADVADKALAMLEIDENGLDEMDKRILETVIVKFGGGPVGISSLAVAVGEEPDTLEEVYEPYLIMEGYLKRTPQGRVATELSYKKLGLKAGQSSQPGLLSVIPRISLSLNAAQQNKLTVSDETAAGWCDVGLCRRTAAGGVFPAVSRHPFCDLIGPRSGGVVPGPGAALAPLAAAAFHGVDEPGLAHGPRFAARLEADPGGGSGTRDGARQTLRDARASDLRPGRGGIRAVHSASPGQPSATSRRRLAGGIRRGPGHHAGDAAGRILRGPGRGGHRRPGASAGPRRRRFVRLPCLPATARGLLPAHGFLDQ